MRAVAALLSIPGADKHPQLNEFVTQVLLNLMRQLINILQCSCAQIKSTPDLASLFESIQKDSGEASSNGMDLSWGGGRRGAGRGENSFKESLNHSDSPFFRWGQWECVWVGWCEEEEGWFWKYDGGGPQPSPWTSAPVQKVMNQDFVILLLKSSRGVWWTIMGLP